MELWRPNAPEQEELRLKQLARKLLFPPKVVNAYAKTNRQLRRAAAAKRPRRIEERFAAQQLADTLMGDG